MPDFFQKSLDERVRWEQPDAMHERDVEADEFASRDELDVDPFEIDDGALTAAHAEPLAALGSERETPRNGDRDLGPAPDGLAAAMRASTAHDSQLDALSDLLL